MEALKEYNGPAIKPDLFFFQNDHCQLETH